jgi:glucose-6-phosphate isomerase
MANHINLDYSGSLNFLTEAEISSYSQKVSNSNALLYSGKGKGGDFLGWLDLPASTAKEAINKIKNAAEKLKEKSKFIVVIGIGGSYLGARAVIDALSDNMNFSLKKKERENPLILYAGQNLSEDYLADMLKFLENRDYSLIVISKSGTTTEPAIGFRLFKKHLIYKYGKNEAKERILSVTGKEKGALKKLSDAEGYETFAIPDDVGGRFSVLTPVGLLPIAAAGINIDEILEGAKYMQNFLLSEKSLDKNPADLYAVLRNLLYSKGKMIEILSNYNPSLNYFTEWW